MITDKEISIVVQGPILAQSAFGITGTTTRLVCERLKKIFPESELILSTWEGSSTSDIPYDKLVLSKDPGATWFNYKNYGLLNNCNRLIVSTQAGINATTRKYVLKVRSDLFVLSKSFLEYFYRFPHFDKTYKFVENRIIAFSLHSIKAHKTSLFTMQRPYHISDWAYFGYRQDLQNLYTIPLTKEPQFSQWFLKRCKPFFDIEPHRLWKMPPEQYVTLCFLKKFIDIEFAHTNDISNDNVIKSERLLANNFLVLDQTQFQLVSLKYVNYLQLLYDSLLFSTAIFYTTWLKDYHKYCHVPVSQINIWVKLQICLRQFTCKILNRILLFIEGKEQRISRLVAYLIKKIA